MLARGVSQEGAQRVQIPLHTPQQNRLLQLPSVSKQHHGRSGTTAGAFCQNPAFVKLKFGAGGKHRFHFVRRKCFSKLTQEILSPTFIFTMDLAPSPLFSDGSAAAVCQECSHCLIPEVCSISRSTGTFPAQYTQQQV